MLHEIDVDGSAISGSGPSFDLVIADTETSTVPLINERNDILSLTVISHDNDANVVIEVSEDNVAYYPLYSGGALIEIPNDTAAHITEVACRYIRFSLEAAATNTDDGQVIVRANRDARSN